MKVEVNVTKTRFFVLLAAILVLGGALIAVAYDTVPANPAIFGHSNLEIKNSPMLAFDQGTLNNGDIIPLPPYRVDNKLNATQGECEWVATIKEFIGNQNDPLIAADARVYVTSDRIVHAPTDAKVHYFIFCQRLVNATNNYPGRCVESPSSC